MDPLCLIKKNDFSKNGLVNQTGSVTPSQTATAFKDFNFSAIKSIFS